MASQHYANIVHLSSGQILFADPTKTWSPNDFPNLPSTSLSIGVNGTIDSANISSLTFTNATTYEPYEPVGIRPTLLKTLQIDHSGQVCYKETRVGFVSTFNGAFSNDVVLFYPSTIGGANILDSTTANPDTITNALGKLDSWITNAFLLQPPLVKPIEADHTSLYGGIRWLNFNTYSILDKFVPYVTSMLFIIGDPASSDYCTFELSDPKYFPYKKFTDGISPYYYPIVRLRIFTDFFLTNADEIYTKEVMKTKCIRLIDEHGNCTFPTRGKVIAFEHTDATTSYTTLSIYLPNIPMTYPKGTSIPVRIAFLNKTDSPVNLMVTSTVQNTIGYPSPIQSILPMTATDTSQALEIFRPIYSDQPGAVEACYFSSYTFQYTLQQMNVANSSNVGYKYGIPNPQTIPTFLAPYSNTTFQQSFVFTLSTQTVTLRGANTIDSYPLIPGAVWSTSAIVYNSAHIPSTRFPGPIVSTLFPSVYTPMIRSVPLTATSPGVRHANRGDLTYISYNAGWNIGNNVSTDVLFLSSPTTLDYKTSTLVQYNDATYPGDRSTMILKCEYTNANALTKQMGPLYLSTFNNDVPLQTILSWSDTSNTLRASMKESKLHSTAQKFFYNAEFSGSQYVDAISTATQSIQLIYTNRRNPGLQSAIQLQTLSTPVYTFQTEPGYLHSTTNILYTNVCTSTTQVAGIYTPTVDSRFLFDLQGVNMAHMYAGSKFGYGQLYREDCVVDTIGPLYNYTSNMRLYSNTTEITTLPFPQNTILRLSTCYVSVYSNVYQDPNDPKEICIRSAFTPANPLAPVLPFVSSITSTLFIDTVSLNTYSTFTNTTGANGLRIVSLLPRVESPGTQYNMDDGVTEEGECGNGLDVSISSFVTLGQCNTVSISTGIYYQHASTLSNATYTDTYTRELLYTNGRYIHPAGFDFSQFRGDLIGQPDAIYPNFTYDQIYDENGGFRYASFAYESPVYSIPTPLQFINVRIKNPNLVSTIGCAEPNNAWFPDAPQPTGCMQSMLVRLHIKVFGIYNTGTYQRIETAWLNGFKQIDEFVYDDQIFDIGAGQAATRIVNDIEYKIQINRRYYTKLCYIVRIGIGQAGSIYSGDPVTFDAIEAYPSDDACPDENQFLGCQTCAGEPLV